MIEVPWAELKKFSDDRKASIQYWEASDRYDCHVFDGPFHLRCQLAKGSDESTEFEADYKPSGNRSPKTRIVQSLGEDSFTISPRGMAFTATAGGATVFDKQLDAALAIKGGKFFASGASVGDWIEVVVIDKDNVLGLGPDTVLKDYVPEWFVVPDVIDSLEDISIGLLPAPGLYLRVTYHSVGIAPVKCILNLLSWEVA